MRIKKDKYFIDEKLRDRANTFQNSYFIVLFLTYSYMLSTLFFRVLGILFIAHLNFPFKTFSILVKSDSDSGSVF